MAKSPTEHIREMVAEIRVLAERDENRRREVDRLVARADAFLTEVTTLSQENAVLRQLVQDHIAQYQEWDRRRWGLITLLIGTVLSLASGLIVTLARK